MYSIVDQHAEFLVVNKAPGIIAQGGSESLLQILKSDLKLAQLYPVHRLDRDTSGLLVLAKTNGANQALSMAFQQRQVNKYYLALTDKKPRKKQGLVVGDMAKARNGSYKLMRSQNNPAKTAFFSFALDRGQRLVALKIYTGKTHQIRVALRALGAPIVGDDRYGGSKAERLYLHAAQIQFQLDGQTYSYASVPDRGSEFLTPLWRSTLASIGPLAELTWPQSAGPEF